MERRDSGFAFTILVGCFESSMVLICVSLDPLALWMVASFGFFTQNMRIMGTCLNVEEHGQIHLALFLDNVRGTS